MMKMIPTIQGMVPAPSIGPGIAFSQPQFMDQSSQNSLASSPLDGMRMKQKPGIFGQPSQGTNIFGGQGPANILPDSKGNVGTNPNPNGVTNPLFQTPGMDQISKMFQPSAATPQAAGADQIAPQNVPSLGGSTMAAPATDPAQTNGIPQFGMQQPPAMGGVDPNSTLGMDQISKMLMMGGLG